jgi:signal transduction histidine kinase
MGQKDHWLWLMYNTSSDMEAVVQVEPGPEFRVLSVNPKYLEVVRAAGYNVTLESFAGKTISEVATQILKFSPGAAAELRARYVRVIQSPLPLLYEEITDTPVGRFYGESRLTPIPDSSGQAAYVVYASRDITERKRTAAELETSRDQLRLLTFRIEAVREEERSHAARDIHDVLAQDLTVLKMEIDWMKRHLGHPRGGLTHAQIRRHLKTMNGLTDQAIQSVQRIATELRPGVLDSLGLPAAIHWQAREFRNCTGIPCEVVVPDGKLKIDRERSTALFRILQESLTNITRHATATRVQIELREDPKQLVLTIRDNGRGIRPAELADPRSIGLLGMRERAFALNGTCEITAPHDGGTLVEVRLPFLVEKQP